MCDRIAVMYLGKIVEIGPTESILGDTHNPYTQVLLSAVPVPDSSHVRPEVVIKGGVIKAINFPDECRFVERCPYAQDVCHSSEHPPLEGRVSGYFVSCHFVDASGGWTGLDREAVEIRA